jgi:hypothetical protein
MMHSVFCSRGTVSCGVFKTDTAMPITLTADEEDAAMKAGSSELKFLFDRERVPSEVQAKFYHIG